MIANRLRFRAWVKQDTQDGLKKGWLKDQCEWFYLDPDGENIEWGYDHMADEPLLIGRDVEVLFSTGQTDKNGVEIFERDIVIKNVLIEPVRHKGTYWVDRKFVVKYKKQSFSPEHLWDCKVIGNIYQDSHLLEKEISVEDMQKIVDVNEKLVKELKNAKD